MDRTGRGLNCNNMSQTVVAQAAPIVAPTFGVIDPTTGHMMNPDNVAVHWEIGPDQGDPSLRKGLLGLPFPGQEFSGAH